MASSTFSLSRTNVHRHCLFGRLTCSSLRGRIPSGVFSYWSVNHKSNVGGWSWRRVWTWANLSWPTSPSSTCLCSGAGPEIVCPWHGSCTAWHLWKRSRYQLPSISSVPWQRFMLPLYVCHRAEGLHASCPSLAHSTRSMFGVRWIRYFGSELLTSSFQRLIVLKCFWRLPH